MYIKRLKVSYVPTKIVAANDTSLDLELEEVKRDPTFFSSVDQKCQSIVQSLTNCTEDRLPDGASPEDLTRFKEIYLDTAFICRSRECARHFEGFSSSAARDEHETCHTKPLRCAEPFCESFSRGFASKKALDTHNRNQHPSLDEIELPKFEPRSVPEPPVYVPAPEQFIIDPPPPKEQTLVQANDQSQRQKAVRKSRAKRGLPVHPCEVCGKVNKSFRPQI